MPHWGRFDRRFDKNGKEIFPGDVLKGGSYKGRYVIPAYSLNHLAVAKDGLFLESQIFVCVADGQGDYLIEVRDTNANNICTCELGPTGDVVNLGNFLDNLDLLQDNDLEYYFGLTREAAEKMKSDLCKTK